MPQALLYKRIMFSYVNILYNAMFVLASCIFQKRGSAFHSLKYARVFYFASISNDSIYNKILPRFGLEYETYKTIEL